MQRIYVMSAATVVLVIAALAAGFGLSTGWAVKALQDEALARLGRTLTIKDGVSLEFSPRLVLRFEGVELGNPDGFEGAFVRARSLRIPVSLADILQRRIAGRFELEAPEISLEVNLRGDVSWAGPGKGPALPISESFVVENGTVRFYDQRNQQSIIVSKARLMISLSPEGELTADGNAMLGGRLSGITAYIKDVGRVAETGSPFDLSIAAPPLKAAFNGRLSTRGALNLAGKLALDGPSLRETAQWINMPIPGARGLGQFSISGTLDSQGIDFTLNNAAVALDGLSASGDVGVTASRLAPLVFAKLALPALELDAFVASPDIAANGWSEEALSYEGLRGLNARMTLAVEQLSLGSMAAGASNIEASLAEGRLSVVIASDDLAGGRGRIDLELDGSSQAPLFSARLVAQQAEAQTLLKQFTGQGWLSGRADADIAISGFGTSVAAIIATLKGAATFKVAQGVISGLDGPALVASVTQRIADGWGTPESSTPFESFGGSLTISDGIAETADLKLEGANFAAEASGQVDVLRRAIDLSVLPSVSSGLSGKMVGLPVPVVVKGAWGTPRIYPDIADILLKPDEGFARLKQLGLPASGN